MKPTRIYFVVMLMACSTSCTSLKHIRSSVTQLSDKQKARLEEQYGDTPLTAKQQQWLNAYLKEKDSAPKRFRKLIKVIGRKEAYVREAASQKIHKLLIAHPTLANKNAITTIRKITHKVDNAAEAKQALQLLCVLVEVNPKLALSAVKVVVDLTENELTQKGIGLDMLSKLTQTTIDASPKCIDYLLQSIYKHMGSIDARRMTGQKLLVIDRLLDTDIVKKTPLSLTRVLSIVLDAARSKDTTVELRAQKLLAVLMQEYPVLTKDRFDFLVEFAHDKSPNMLAMAQLVAFATVDRQYVEKDFSLLMNIFQTTESRIHRQAAQNSNNRESHGLIVDAIFKKLDKKLAARKARLQEYHQVIAPALELLPKLAAIESAYLGKAFAMAQKYLDDKKEDYRLKGNALNALASVVKNSTAYTLEAIAMASHATYNKEVGIRKAALDLLRTIIETDKQYSQDPTVLANIKRLTHDKNAAVRQLAEELLACIPHEGQ